MFDIRIGIDTAGTLDRLQREMAAMPEGVARAQKRALRKLSTWVNRQVLRESAKAAGTTQKLLKSLLRYRATVTPEGIAIWIGTNPIKAHHLGAVKWTPKMIGARVGKRSYPGTFSHANSQRMAGLVVLRLTDTRLPVEAVTVPIHGPILTRVQQMQPEIDARFRTLLVQELNYALLHEAAR